MAQLTLRIDDELARRLKQVAAEQQRSVNAYAAAVLGAAVDPELAEDELQRVRERLARAGLLAEVGSPSPRHRPRSAAVAAAGRRAARGTPLSDLVGEGRE